VGVFHLPYRAHLSPLVRVARNARTRVPGVNALANVLRRKPASTPLIESSTYDLNEVLAILQEQQFDAPHLVFTRHGDLDGVIIHAVRKWSSAASPESCPSVSTQDSALSTQEFIDVQKLIASTSIDALNRTAEKYFAGLENWSITREAVCRSDGLAAAPHQPRRRVAGTAARAGNDRARVWRGDGMARALSHATRLPRDPARRGIHCSKDRTRALREAADDR
jgi:hypothetical protein